MKRKILVVDDNEISRLTLRETLRDEYEVLEAENGKDALELMHRTHKLLSAVLIDIIMPEMDGYELLKNIRKNAMLRQVPTIVVTGDTAIGTEEKALSLGATDFVTKPYNIPIVKQRIKNIINLRETSSIINSLQRDRLTGVYDREAFLDKAGSMIAAQGPGYYVLSCLDVDKFKVINEKYGMAKGDEILKFLAETFNKGFSELGGICGRITADVFAVLYPRKFINSNEVENIRRVASTPKLLLRPIVISVGEYVITDIELPVSTMFDRAALAVKTIKGRFDTRTAIFDESMMEQELREQEVADEMGGALKTNQFEAWFQPQYDHSSGALIGAEVLTRWHHLKKGLLMPCDFIPIFERNGFIYEMDKFIWEQVCVTLRRWLDEGDEPLPLSVNISRYNIIQRDFYETLTRLVKKYNIPTKLLRLELTESAFNYPNDEIVSMAERLAKFGFTIAIDDFGSGYSLLNTLKNVPANILKLDMHFLEDDGTARGRDIVESVVLMTKSFGMPVIAERVETRQQADFLKSVGCHYVQGYLYARPMPIEEYEELAKSHSKEHKPTF
ncbi:MAG: EAL domain-containing protein [Synergistaceae bacterium]|nr:EAL domain-containing protein [Synergistaceae bacterium]